MGLQFGAAADNTYVSIPFVPQVDRQKQKEERESVCVCD